MRGYMRKVKAAQPAGVVFAASQAKSGPHVVGLQFETWSAVSGLKEIPPEGGCIS